MDNVTEEDDPNISNNQLSIISETNSDLEVSDKSDNDLEIDLTEARPSRSVSTSVSENLEQDIIETIEHEIGKQLIEKAEKNNLTVQNVKGIIRQVLTNEHVRALLEKGEAFYEPKLTRAKAKELISASVTPVPPVNIPWVPQPPPSETHVLIGEDLKEDDSGDEYVPGEEESEDDRDESIASESDISSLPPPTPPTIPMEDHATQTLSYTDDGVFKIPPPKTLEEELDEAANIALRTRSKINLSSTPLEVIEKNFVPPDITTDMYDMECDDDEWRDFLKGFTEPLEEVTKPTDDEEHDPEYNILADDEINQIDNEDFRVDKAVKISKKEVKELWEELFEYLHNMSEEYEDPNNKTQDTVNNTMTEEQPSCSNISQGEFELSETCEINITLEECDKSSNKSVQKTDKNTLICSTPKKKENEPKISPENKSLPNISIEHKQICIIEQQMRQHVQMLTQNFLLTYDHPEFHHYSIEYHEFLLNLKHLGDKKTFTLFRPVNLLPALNLVTSWINLFATNGEEVIRTKKHVEQELNKSLQCRMAGNWRYVLTFPKLFLETVSQSDVFLYPSLLPKIPFKSDQFFGGDRCVFTDGENSLLVFGLDMFKKFLLDQKVQKRRVLKETVAHVQEYMMPHRTKESIYRHIIMHNHSRCATNPIQQYFLHGQIKSAVHYLYPVNQLLPPCKRLSQELPEQWKNFIYPQGKPECTPKNPLTVNSLQTVVPNQVIIIGSPYLESLLNSPVCAKKRNRNKRSIQSTPKRKAKPSRFKQCTVTENTFFKNNRHFTTTNGTPIELFTSIFLQPLAVQKLVSFLSGLNTSDNNRRKFSSRVFAQVEHIDSFSMLPNMPTLNTPIKTNDIQCSQDDTAVSSTTLDSINIEEERVEADRPLLSTEHKKPETVTSSTINQDSKREKCTKNLEFSTIISSSFQQANNSAEVEFCRNSSNIQICQTSQSDDHIDKPSSSGHVSVKSSSEKENTCDKASMVMNVTAKPNAKKELSGAEKKKNKLRKDFIANMSITTPEDPESIRHKNEMFAIAYYDKLRESLELDDYHKVMQILNDFEAADVVDLYREIRPILYPKYEELAEEFLFFLKEKEAAAVGQLIPWLEVQTRSKFLRKLEIYFKDQPAQLRKIYNCLMELTHSENTTMEKVKSVLLPMLKGNTILIDLFLQNFRDERPPPSLLEGPYETIDVHKELAKPNNEEPYEMFIVPNTEDKYGGPNCLCHCHKIEDNEYKSRYKHCKSCGLKFANGKLLLQSGRGLKPATVTFELNPSVNHNTRLLGKSVVASSTHKKKRSDTSPSKQVNTSGKENLDEDTEDEEISKRKRSVSQKTPRKRKKTDQSIQDSCKSSSPKKSPARNNENLDVQKDIKPRKRTYSGKRSKKEEYKKTEGEFDKTDNEFEKIDNEFNKTDNEFDKIEELKIADEKVVDEDVEVIVEVDEVNAETSEEQQDKCIAEDCMDSSGESIEKPLTPGQQTAESESDIYVEESSQDNYESDDSSSSTESAKGSQSDNNINEELGWKREEDTIILETLQKEDDKEYALQVISDKLSNRTIGQIRSRLSKLMTLLIETLKNS